MDLAVAVGELPEEHPQPDVQLGLLGDRHRGDEPQRAGHRPARELGAELRPVCGARRPARVQHRDPRRRDHAPRPLDLERGIRVELPGPQQIARAEQLGRVAPTDADPPEQQPVDDQHPVAAAGTFDRLRLRLTPGAGSVPQEGGPGRLARLGPLVDRHQLRQPRIHVEHAHLVRHL
jgi:hypothetical protein